MRAHSFGAVFRFALATLPACGAARATVESPKSAPTVASEMPAPPTPEPKITPSTTTATLPDSHASGEKLAPTGSASAGVKRTSETGRGPDDIRMAVLARRDAVRTCYDNARKDHPELEGDLDIRWTIDPEGHVGDAAVDPAHTTLVDPQVGKCVVAVISQLKFSRSGKGLETRAHYPFNFNPRSGGKLANPDAPH